MGNWPNHRIAIPAGFIIIYIALIACLCNKHIQAGTTLLSPATNPWCPDAHFLLCVQSNQECEMWWRWLLLQAFPAAAWRGNSSLQNLSPYGLTGIG